MDKILVYSFLGRIKCKCKINDINYQHKHVINGDMKDNSNHKEDNYTKIIVISCET